MAAAEYDIHPVAHLRLLSGQHKVSDAGGTGITDQYYVFSAINKTSGREESILCGIAAARDLLAITGADPLPLFDPLKHLPEPTAGSEREQARQGESKPPRPDPDVSRKWHPEMLELFNGAMLLITAWDAEAGTPLFRLVESCRKWFWLEPYIEKIEQLNRIVGKDAKYRSMDGVVRDLKRMNPALKSFTFDRLRERLYKERPGVKVYI